MYDCCITLTKSSELGFGNSKFLITYLVNMIISPTIGLSEHYLCQIIIIIIVIISFDGI